jgi:hypothetical protein
MPEIGDHVIFVDEYRVRHHALVTAVHGNSAHAPINLVYVAKDNRVDQYGKQTIHQSSVVHEEFNSTKAFCWVEA